MNEFFENRRSECKDRQKLDRRKWRENPKPRKQKKEEEKKPYTQNKKKKRKLNMKTKSELILNCLH